MSTPALSSQTAAQPLLKCSLKALGPVRLVPLIAPADRALWNEYAERYLYLGYKRPFGYRQRYFIEAGQHRLGCVLLSGASRALGARDRWIGWDDRQRMKNLPWVLNNNRFLLFPWVLISNLASHVLGQLVRRAGDDWQQRWGYRPVLLETFVDPMRFVYVLEASLCFQNGMVIPLLSEFLEYQPGDGEQSKQDCETKAFHRLAARIKQAFHRLPMMLLLDGLYPNGPIMARCHQYHWDFMIVLKDGSLPTAWEEYHSLLLYQQDNHHRQNWGERRQHFQWVNAIRYYFGANDKNRLDLNVVVCTEQWEEVDPKTAQIITKESKQAWISSRSISRLNVHTRCNLGARYRWGIEGAFLVEKHDVHGCTNTAMAGCQRTAQGYSSEHAFAKNWNAMKGYHYLMRLGHLINTLA